MMSLIKPLAIGLLLAACTSSSNSTSSELAAISTDPGAATEVPSCVPPAGSTAPTYTDLYARYFAEGTPGHCANGGCHGSARFRVWKCGSDKDTCYTGMVNVGLISTSNPSASLIGDPTASPLFWVNPDGFMPPEEPTALPEARDAILAWVAACAQNN